MWKVEVGSPRLPPLPSPPVFCPFGEFFWGRRGHRGGSFLQQRAPPPQLRGAEGRLCGGGSRSGILTLTSGPWITVAGGALGASDGGSSQVGRFCNVPGIGTSSASIHPLST